MELPIIVGDNYDSPLRAFPHPVYLILETLADGASSEATFLSE